MLGYWCLDMTMETKKINFGKPAVVDSVELGQTDAQSLYEGYQDEFGCYVKRPGLTLFATLPKAAKVDGIYESIAGTVIAVCSGQPYTLAVNGSSTAWTGTKLTAGNPVIFTEDLSNIFAAHGGKITKLVQTTKVASDLAGNSPQAGVTHIIFKDRYLLCNGTDSLVGDQFFSDDQVNAYSASNSWEVFNNEENADPLTAVAEKWGETLSMGPESIEFVEDDGITPWAKMAVPPPGVGLLAPYSIVDLGSTFYFLSVYDRAPRIVRLENRSIRAISYPIDPLISTTTAPFSQGFGLTINRIPFYVVTNQIDGFTLVYNALQNTWSQFASWNGSAYDFYPCNTTRYIKGWNTTLIGDTAATGKIWTLDGLTDDGDPIRFELTSGNTSWGTDRRKRSAKLLFKCKRGQSADISEPYFKVQFNDDGKGWSEPRRVSLGFADDLSFYGVLYQCGTYRQRQYRVVHDDVKSDFILVSAEETFEVLTN
jgi:hypothetical protein